MVSITNRSEELKQMIQEAKDDIDQKKTEVSKVVDDKTQDVLKDALKQLEKQNDSQLQTMKQTIELLSERLIHVEADNSAVKLDNFAIKQDISLIQQRLTQIESSVEELDTIRSAHKKQLEYVKQKQELQGSLVERYGKGYFKTWISPLKTQDNDIDVNEIYVTPNMVVEKKTNGTASTSSLSGQETAEGLARNRSSAGNRKPSPGEQNVESELKTISRYEDIFQTDDARHKKIYIIGDIGTGKSTLNKMMIYNWCRAVIGDNENAESNEENWSSENAESTEVSLDDSDSESQEENWSSENAESTEDSLDGSDSESDDESWLNYLSSEHAAFSTSDMHNESKSAGRDKIQANAIREMSKFDFLFTIPLQRVSGISDIKEMIKVLYKDVMTDGLVDKIFNQESERCLIIADGLDEWSPPKHAPSPQHVSYGIPVADGIKNATFVTLSRPSARGILNMKLTEYDQKIKLQGVCKVFLDDFIKKYMRKLNKIKLTDEFKTKIIQAKLEHLEKTPLILQQLIWMFCTGVDTGKSIGDIYSNIVNIMFGRSEKKGEEDTTQSSVNTEREIKQIQLPKLLRRFPRCEENKRILFLFGELAFKILTEDMISTFGRSDLYHCGLSKDEIGKLVTYGILVEYNCFDPTIENTQLSFIHTSYLEFFAAVYISSHYSEQHLTHEQKPILENRMVLKELFMKYKSAEDILQLSNLLKMVCELSPFLLEEISSLISENMMSDESMIKYRNELSQLSNYDMDDLDDMDDSYDWFDMYDLYSQNVAAQIQRLIFDCFEECGTVNPPAVSLCDVMIPDELYSDFLRESCLESFCQNIVSSSVLSIDLYSWRRVTETIKWISELHQLQFIRIEDIMSCEASEQLSLSLKETELMKTLNLESIFCDKYKCKGHTIDLSGHSQLQSIYLKNCSVMLSSLVNTKSLENVSISKSYGGRTPHVICEHLSSSLSQAVSLKQLTLKDIVCDRDNCEGHTINLSKHDQLQSIEIEDCSCLLGSVVNTKNLERVSIIGVCVNNIPHVMCEHLSSSLSQAVSLKQLTLEDIVCDRDNCEGHPIDLPKHDQLQSIEIEDCSCLLGSVVNTKNLERVSIIGVYVNNIPHVMCEHLSSSLSQVVSLKQLTLRDIVCDRDNCEVHTINLSKHDQLQSVDLSNFSISSINTKNLRTLKVSRSDVHHLLQSCYNSKLEHLSISDINRQYTSEMNSVVQTLQHLHTLELKEINIDENALTVTAGMKNLKNITLGFVIMSFETWRSFVDSLLQLQHSVEVDLWELSIGQGQKDAALQYGRQNRAIFEVVTDD